MFFRSDLNLAKGTIDDNLLCEQFKLVKIEKNPSYDKNASYNKVLHEEIKLKKKKIKFLYKSKTKAIGKSLVKNRIKNKTFFCTTVSKFQEIKHLRWSKTDPKK